MDFEQELLSNPATLSPVQITDPRSLIGLVGQLKEIDVTNPVQMWNTITPYLLTPRPNPSVSTAYREMLSAMKASIDSEMN